MLLPNELEMLRGIFMNKSKYLVFLFLVLIVTQFAGLNFNSANPVMQTLSNFSANAKYWSVVSLYHSNYQGYQISSEERKKIALN